MRLLLVIIYILTSANEAIACGLQGDTSVQSLLKISQQMDVPASKYLPKTIINGASRVAIKNDQGIDIKIDESLVLIPGMTIAAAAGKAKIQIPSTGQSIELQPGTMLKILNYNKSADEKICSISFEMQSGSAEFTSEHQKREKECKPTRETFEVATRLIEITPIGTKFNVDLNQEIAELNGEVYETENVSVKKGQVKIRLVKLKKISAFKKSKKQVIAANDSDDEKPVVVKARSRAKVKKSRKDRMADIQIVYPEQ